MSAIAVSGLALGVVTSLSATRTGRRRRTRKQRWDAQLQARAAIFRWLSGNAYSVVWGWALGLHLAWLDGLGLALLVPAAVVACVQGVYAPHAALGTAVGLLVSEPPGLTSTLWMSAVFLGHLGKRAYQSQRSEVMRAVREWWYWTVLVRLSRYGTRGGTGVRPAPPGSADRALVLTGAVIALVPLATALLHSAGTPLIWAAGAVTSCVMFTSVMACRRLTRFIRRVHSAMKTLLPAAGMFLAAGPAGDWLAAVSRGSFPMPSAWPELIAALGAGWAFSLAARRVPLIDAEHSSLLLRLAPGLAFLFVMVVPGLCVVGIRHASGLLLWTTVVLGVRMLLAGTGDWPEKATFVVMLRLPWMRTSERESWLHDAVLARPRRPDFRLPVHIARQATLASSGGTTRLSALAQVRAGHLTGTDALDWLDTVEEWMRSIDTDVLPHVPVDARPGIRHRRDLVLAHVLAGRGVAHRHLGHEEEALAMERAEVALLEELGARHAAAVVAAGLPVSLAYRLRRHDEAERELERLRSKGLLPMRTIRSLEIILAHELGQRDRMLGLRADLLRLPDPFAFYFAAARDFDSLIDVQPRPVRWMTRWRLARLLRSSAHVLHGIALRADPLGDQPFPSRGKKDDPAVYRRHFLRGRTLRAAGRRAAARRELERAARSAHDHGNLAWVLRSHLELADLAQESGESADRVWTHLDTALRSHERLRDLVIDPATRMEITGLQEQAYEQAVSLLAVQQSALIGVENCAVAAFETAEQARSRVFLEELGSHLPDILPSDTEAATALISSEHSLRQRLDQRLAKLPSAPPEEQAGVLADIRLLRRQLNTLYEDLRQEGTTAAVYALRRQGRPVGYAEIRTLLAEGA
jgi:tetratricopeptide (TPR) repeat protein